MTEKSNQAFFHYHAAKIDSFYHIGIGLFYHKVGQNETQENKRATNKTQTIHYKKKSRASLLNS